MYINALLRPETAGNGNVDDPDFHYIIYNLDLLTLTDVHQCSAGTQGGQKQLHG